MNGGAALEYFLISIGIAICFGLWLGHSVKQIEHNERKPNRRYKRNRSAGADSSGHTVSGSTDPWASDSSYDGGGGDFGGGGASGSWGGDGGGDGGGGGD